MKDSAPWVLVSRPVVFLSKIRFLRGWRLVGAQRGSAGGGQYEEECGFLIKNFDYETTVDSCSITGATQVTFF